MAFYLLHKDEVVKRYSAGRWSALLALARAYGWRPAGVQWQSLQQPQKQKHRSSDYEVMAHQRVTTQDACNLADSLEKALVHFPRADEERTLALQLKTNFWDFVSQAQRQHLDWFVAREEETTIEDFIAFCREGEFTIT